MKNILLVLCTLNMACGWRTRCVGADKEEEGTATLSLDGEDLSYEASWLLAGSSLQVNIENQNSSMTIRLSTDEEGRSISDIGSDSAIFSLGDSAGGTATLYPESGSSATINADNPGIFVLSSFDEKTLTGCFDFTAKSQDGTEYQVESGAVNASESSLNQ